MTEFKPIAGRHVNIQELYNRKMSPLKADDIPGAAISAYQSTDQYSLDVAVSLINENSAFHQGT